MKKTIISLSIVFLVFLFAACNERDTNRRLPAIPAGDHGTNAAVMDAATVRLGILQVQNNMIISANTWHSLAVFDGTLWSLGNVWQPGALAFGEAAAKDLLPVKLMDEVFFAAAGLYHALAIDTDGTLWAWGQNLFGQLGDGTTEARFEPVRIMEGVVHAAISPALSNAHVSYGARSYALKGDGTLWAWGQNAGSPFGEINGALGDGSTQERHFPVLIMANVMYVAPTQSGGFAITTDNSLWMWCNSRRYRDDEGNWQSRESWLYPVRIMDDISSVYVNDRAYFAITTNGALWMLGPWLREPVLLVESGIRSASGARETFFVITFDSVLWAWGQNGTIDQWQWAPFLGDGTIENKDNPIEIMENVMSITVSGDTVFAITEDGTLWAWGPNGIGQLGDGTTEARLSPVRIMDNVMSVSSGLHTDHGWIGFLNTFAFTMDGSLWAWGGHLFGAGLLGDGTAEQRLAPVRIVLE